MTLGTCMGATYLSDEPDISTVGQEQWRAWFTALSDDQKLAWASAYKGSAVTAKAAALGLAREYAEKAGFEAEDVYSPYAYYSMEQARQARDRQAMLLAGGAILLFGFFVLRKRRR